MVSRLFLLSYLFALHSCVSHPSADERKKITNSNFSNCCQVFVDKSFSGIITDFENMNSSGNRARFVFYSNEYQRDTLCDYFIRKIGRATYSVHLSFETKSKISVGDTVLKIIGREDILNISGRDTLSLFKLSSYSGKSCKEMKKN